MWTLEVRIVLTNWSKFCTVLTVKNYFWFLFSEAIFPEVFQIRLENLWSLFTGQMLFLSQLLALKHLIDSCGWHANVDVFATLLDFVNITFVLMGSNSWYSSSWYFVWNILQRRCTLYRVFTQYIRWPLKLNMFVSCRNVYVSGRYDVVKRRL